MQTNRINVLNYVNIDLCWKLRPHIMGNGL